MHCLNLGIGAYGIDQMWRALVHHGLALEPDVVVLAFIRNDLDRSMTSYRHDRVWRWKPTYRLDDGELVPVTASDRPAGLAGLVHRHSRLLGLWRKTERSLVREHPIGSLWARNRALFAAVRDECERAGVPLLVVHIPVNKRKPTPMFAREFAALGIDFLDLGPVLPEDAARL